jgi:hypothetical protein
MACIDIETLEELELLAVMVVSSANATAVSESAMALVSQKERKGLSS